MDLSGSLRKAYENDQPGSNKPHPPQKPTFFGFTEAPGAPDRVATGRQWLGMLRVWDHAGRLELSEWVTKTTAKSWKERWTLGFGWFQLLWVGLDALVLREVGEFSGWALQGMPLFLMVLWPFSTGLDHLFLPASGLYREPERTRSSSVAFAREQSVVFSRIQQSYFKVVFGL